MKIEEFTIGMSASYEQTVTDADIKNFAGISGDKNPVHMSDDYAEKSKFKKRIAHGLMSASYFSALFGTKLPGEGCVYVSQNLTFRKPIYIGDTVKAIVTIKDIDIKKHRLFFDTVCVVNGKTVISGDAEIYIPESD
jgi:3-hydroxybutyryl-CoA dehydratase